MLLVKSPDKLTPVRGLRSDRIGKLSVVQGIVVATSGVSAPPRPAYAHEAPPAPAKLLLLRRWSARLDQLPKSVPHTARHVWPRACSCHPVCTVQLQPPPPQLSAPGPSSSPTSVSSVTMRSTRHHRPLRRPCYPLWCHARPATCGCDHGSPGDQGRPLHTAAAVRFCQVQDQ